MNKPTGYDETEAKVGGGEFPQPTAGGYVAKIVTAEIKTSQKGKEMLVLGIDIAEGEFKDHWTKLKEKFENAFYPSIFQLTEGEHTGYFKGLISAIEKSNSGYQWNWNEGTLIGKRLGVNLREEEYKNKNGEVKTSLKVAYFTTAQEAKAGLKPLEPKKLTSSGAPASDFPAHTDNDAPKDDGLPF